MTVEVIDPVGDYADLMNEKIFGPLDMRNA